MPRNPNNKLERYEVALVKAMSAASPDKSDQDILAYFTRPTRSINHARIGDIREGRTHAGVPAASQKELETFLRAWPNVDNSGLHVLGDELLIKAREAMLHAVQGFNNPRALFKAEMFIVTAVISWTYLLHAHFKRLGVDYRQRDRDGAPQLTRHGAEKYWGLETCLEHPRCGVSLEAQTNLKFLIEIRHEIEHRMTTRIDGALSGKLQACCLNFNNQIKEQFGTQYGLDSDLGVALQFSGIERNQRDTLLKDMDLPRNFLAAYTLFEDTLPDALIRDARYSYRVAYVEVSVNSRGKADEVIQFVRPDSPDGQAISRILLKRAEPPKFRANDVVRTMQLEGHADFNLHKHTLLWKAADAKNPAKDFGTNINPPGQREDWRWYETWVQHVQQTLAANRDRI